jgi:hypothetical protein
MGRYKTECESFASWLVRRFPPVAPTAPCRALPRTREEVFALWQRWCAGETQVALGRELGLTSAAVSRMFIAYGLGWLSGAPKPVAPPPHLRHPKCAHKSLEAALAGFKR